ncbi:MAG: cytochrome c biogenesis protein ResB [Nocardioides sp.]|nr:cytochrome c biogenesis protein ResB [Nocardioides sp.]
MSKLDTLPEQAVERRPGELRPRELARWAWRQLTSMRTALILLLLLALAAVPGSVIPQERSDSLDATRWKDAHETLTPIYEKLGLFHVYTSVWFAAIYLLLMISLVGCILPRTFHYVRAIRAEPPAAPSNLTRLPDHASYSSADAPDVVLARASTVLKRKGYRVRAAGPGPEDSVSAERGYLREVGNLVFHLSVLVVLVGFALGGLFGYRGGVILVVGNTFSNNLTQYDDFDPGSLFSASQMEDFDITVKDFDVEWLQDGPRQGMARGFNAGLTYHETQGGPEKSYDLRVNHPLSIGDTDLFLIGHGYAPVLTVRDGEGNVASSGPVVFLPQGPDFFSVGVVKAPFAQPQEIALEGFFYPFFANVDGNPVNVMGDDLNPVVSMQVWTGDLGLKDGVSQSVYLLDKSKATKVMADNGRQLRIDLAPGQTVTLPDGLGTVSFESVVPWNRLQVSQTPGTRIALTGVVLALVGLLGSLFLRPRRVWVRVRRADGPAGGSLVEVAALDRSGGGDVGVVLSKVVDALQPVPADEKEKS